MVQAAYMAGSVILTAAMHISSELGSAGNATILPLALRLPMCKPHLLTTAWFCADCSAVHWSCNAGHWGRVRHSSKPLTGSESPRLL